MEANPVTFAIHKQRDGANIVRQLKRAKDAAPASGIHAVERGGQIVSMQIDNTSLIVLSGAIAVCD